MPVASIDTYANLQTAIADTLDRTDLGTVITSFIQMCEASVNRKLRHHRLFCRSESVGWRTDEFIPLPVDWLESRNVEMVLAKENPDDPQSPLDGERYQLTYVSPDVMDMMKRGDQPVTGFSHYTYYENVLEIYPAPTEEYRLILEYYKKVPTLSDSNTGNWLLENHPDIYLYGSLIHSAPYLRDDPRIAMWDNLFQSALAELNLESERAMQSGSRFTRKPSVVLG